MYPAQTSLIPIAVSLAEFVEKHGLSAFTGWYPNWFLGVPFRYLTGPIMPLIMVGIKRVMPYVTYYHITIYIIIFSFLLSFLGWSYFVYKLSRRKLYGYIVFFTALILPFRYLTAIAINEATLTVTRNLLPLVFLFSFSYLSRKNRINALLVILSILLLLLINTGILPIILVGLASLALAKSLKKGKVKKLTNKIKPLLLFTLTAILLATFCYTPNYWIMILTNPSIGGASGIKVILRIFDLFRASLPLILAFGAVYFSVKVKSSYSTFAATWTFTFLFLTLFRFIGDPDFWQDWTSWIYELEIGISLLMAPVVSSVIAKFKEKGNEIHNISKIHYAILILFLVMYFLTYRVYVLLGRPKLISSSIPVGVSSLLKVKEVVKEDRVFISGSTVFWADAVGDIVQLRGGLEKASIHPYWGHAAYQLREGRDADLAKAWLNALGVEYVLVHNSKSKEYYHDFKNLTKWDLAGELIYEEAGDAIYKIRDSSLAWIVDSEKLKEVIPPKDGKDLNALNSYLNVTKRPIKSVIDANRIVLDIDRLNIKEGVVIAVTYSSKWKAQDANISKDVLGNMLLTFPQGLKGRTVELIYK